MLDLLLPLRVGTDLVEIERIAHLLSDRPQKFLQKIFTPQERSLCPDPLSPKFASHVAKRFAAKESFAKALGTGFGKSLAFHDIEVFNHPSGQPYIQLNPHLLVLHQIHSISLSLSDERAYALAFCVIS